MREAILAKLSCPLPPLSSAVATLVAQSGAMLRHDDDDDDNDGQPKK